MQNQNIPPILIVQPDNLIAVVILLLKKKDFLQKRFPSKEGNEELRRFALISD